MTSTDTNLIPDFFGNIWSVTIHSTGPTIRIENVMRAVEADEYDDAPTWLSLTPEHAIALANKIYECATRAENRMKGNQP